MATKTSKAPPPAVKAAHPPITDYQDVWITHPGVALANNKEGGFDTVLRTDAATMFAAGDAVDVYTTDPLPHIKPKPVPVVVALTAFTAANPTVATASAGDVAKLANGNVLRIAQTGGTTLPELDTHSGTVFAKGVTSFTLTGIDLSASDVTGVTATGTKQ